MHKAVSWLVAPREGKRFRALLAMLFVMIALLPFADSGIGFAVAEVLFTLMLLSAVYAIGTTSRRLTVALALVLLARVVHLLDLDSASLASAILTIVFLAYCCEQMLAFVLSDGPVTTDKLLASLCVYVLMAILFSVAYATIYEIWPDSLRGFSAREDGQPAIEEAAYFSLVTQTTLGYGDITPTASPAGRHVRSIVVIQAMLGQLYLTVLVARLVALHISHRPRRGDGNNGDDGA